MRANLFSPALIGTNRPGSSSRIVSAGFPSSQHRTASKWAEPAPEAASHRLAPAQPPLAAPPSQPLAPAVRCAHAKYLTLLPWAGTKPAVSDDPSLFFSSRPSHFPSPPRRVSSLLPRLISACCWATIVFPCTILPSEVAIWILQRTCVRLVLRIIPSQLCCLSPLLFPPPSPKLPDIPSHILPSGNLHCLRLS